MNWDLSEEEFRLIAAIARRGARVWEINNEPPHYAIMDLNACHSNGCPLKLKELLEAKDSDFFHDVGSIRRHINRQTGQIEGGFWPRYARDQ